MQFRANHHHDGGEQGHTDDPGEHLSARLVLVTVPALGRQPTQGSVGDDERDGEVEQDEDADEQHGHAAPLGEHLVVLFEGLVTRLRSLVRLHDIPRQVGQYGEVVCSAVLEDVVL